MLKKKKTLEDENKRQIQSVSSTDIHSHKNPLTCYYFFNFRIKISELKKNSLKNSWLYAEFFSSHFVADSSWSYNGLQWGQ